CPLPASVLDARVLPSRVEGFRAWDLDALCASGRVTWAGVEPLGSNDGRIALYLAEDEPLLAVPPKPVEGDLPAKIRALLEKRCTPRGSRVASPPCTTCSRRWRMAVACAAGTSSPAAARRSSRSRGPTIVCARCAHRATRRGRSFSRPPTRQTRTARRSPGPRRATATATARATRRDDRSAPRGRS